MIRLDTFEDLHCHHHGLSLYCPDCERWGRADLEALIRTGRGGVSVGKARFRCRDCGALVEKLVQPPVPSLGDAIRYIRCTPAEARIPATQHNRQPSFYQKFT